MTVIKERYMVWSIRPDIEEPPTNELDNDERGFLTFDRAEEWAQRFSERTGLTTCIEFQVYEITQRGYEILESDFGPWGTHPQTETGKARYRQLLDVLYDERKTAWVKANSSGTPEQEEWASGFWCEKHGIPTYNMITTKKTCTLCGGTLRRDQAVMGRPTRTTLHCNAHVSQESTP